MKLSHIAFRPVAHVHFTVTDLLIIRLCAAHHYDGRCKDMARKDGFLDKLRNHKRNARYLPIRLEWEQIDTMCKALEMGKYLPDKHQAAHSVSLGVALRQVLLALNDATPDMKTDVAIACNFPKKP